MPQPVTYNPGTPVSGSIQENSISYVVDGQNRNYRGGFGGLSWMSEVPAANNVIFIGNSTSLGRGPANIPLFYPSYNNSAANIVYAANTLPGSPRNFTTTGSAYNWAATNNFFINNSNNPIPRINGDSLGLYIDANQPTSYPQTGTTWFDLSGIGNNCGLYNGPTWNSNGYIQFDGTDDFVGVGNTGVTKLNQNYQTLRFLIYITSVGPNGYSELYAVTNANRTGIKWQSDGIGMDANGDFYNVFVNVSNAYSQWMDISCVIDRVGNIFKVYKNGTYIGQDTFTPYTANSTDITIGANRLTGNGGDYIKGNISEVSVYGKELSLSEIKQNYFQGNIVTGSLVFMVDANNLVSYPKSGTAWYNLTGSASSGTLVNGPIFSYNNGGSIVFDGIDDYVNLSTDPWPANAFTNDSISIWFKFTNYGVILGQNLSTPFGASGWVPAIYIDTSFYLRTSVFWGGSTGNQSISPSPLSTDTWYNLTVTNESNTQKTYLNGELIATLSKTQTAYAGAYYYTLGAGRWNGWSGTTGDIGYLQGQIANLYYYDKTLTPTEIQQNYQATKDKFLGQNIVTNGLVLNLDAANKDSYPGIGNTWYDLSGNGYNGTLTNGTSFVSNIYGGYFNFDGVDDYVDLQYAIIGGTGDFTVNQWIQADASETGGTTFGNYPAGTLQIFYGTTYMGMWLNNSSTYVDSPVPFSSNPVMITTIRSGTTTYFYQNGILLKTGSSSANIGAANFRIGTNTSTSEQFTGRVFVTQTYNRALSSTEVLQNYNATKTRFGL
jgi:hypothetical protein